MAIIGAEAFAPFGTLIAPAEDGKLFGLDQAQLELTRGMLRFYVMRLKRRDEAFTHITRHLSVTQCLASVGGKPWLLAGAPPADADYRRRRTRSGGHPGLPGAGRCRRGAAPLGLQARVPPRAPARGRALQAA